MKMFLNKSHRNKRRKKGRGKGKEKPIFL